MSTTIELHFLTGRFHATPWGRHVNEAATEWPPSPWRFLRALVWVWKHKAPDLLTTHEAKELFQTLAEAPPSFNLPTATQAHTRHYMPWFKKGPYDKTLVFDAFVAIGRGTPVAIIWPVDLTAQQREKLATLSSLLGHLGRAESWCSAQLAEHSPMANCSPAGTEQGINDSSEIVSVLCADGANAFRAEQIPKPKTKGKQASLALACDPPWHLCLDTQQLQNEGWSDPPGSCWVRYRRNPNAFLALAAPSRATPAEVFHSARYLVDSVVKPLLQDTLAVAETARRYLMGIYRRIEEDRLEIEPKSSLPGQCSSATFSGKSADGIPLIGHNHAYFLPLDRDGDGRIDQLVVYSRLGFSPIEAKALRSFNKIPLGEDHPVRLALLGLEKANPWPLATTWISSTPYLATRFAKKNGTKRDPAAFFGPGGDILLLQADLLLQIQRAGLPDPKQIEPLLDSNGVFRSHFANDRLGLRPIQFLTRRRKEDRFLRRPAGFFRIVWDLPVNGPICLGHNSHFGLGLFQPIG